MEQPTEWLTDNEQTYGDPSETSTVHHDAKHRHWDPIIGKIARGQRQESATPSAQSVNWPFAWAVTSATQAGGSQTPPWGRSLAVRVVVFPLNTRRAPIAIDTDTVTAPSFTGDMMTKLGDAAKRAV
jgi:hypothetical protein